MKRCAIIILFAIIFLASSGCILLFAQASETKNTSLGTETQSTPVTTESQPVPTAIEPQETPLVTGPEVQWLWGEVVSVDTTAKTMIVKYLDYETDTEKEITINVDDKTTYENAKSLDEIKTQDTLSIDYVAVDGKDIAKNISVEKNEGVQALPEESKEEPNPTPGLE